MSRAIFLCYTHVKDISNHHTRKDTLIEQRRIERIEERLEKPEHTCGETEPIKVTRIEIDTGDMRERFDWINKRQADTERTLDNHTTFLKDLSTEQETQSGLLQTIFTLVGTQGTDIAMLKHEMQGARADITSIKATQSDHSELLKDMATKADIAALKATQDERFSKMEATQDERFSKIEATQDERFSKIEATQAEILALLKQQRPGK